MIPNITKKELDTGLKKDEEQNNCKIRPSYCRNAETGQQYVKTSTCTLAHLMEKCTQQEKIPDNNPQKCDTKKLANYRLITLLSVVYKLK